MPGAGGGCNVGPRRLSVLLTLQAVVVVTRLVADAESAGVGASGSRRFAKSTEGAGSTDCTAFAKEEIKGDLRAKQPRMHPAVK